MRFKFAHLADLHLDTPFVGLRSYQPDLATTLRDASLAAWDDAVAACLAAEVDFVVVAGDVYESDEAGVRAQLRFRDGLARLAAAGVPSFVVHGNHDPRGGKWSAVERWPDGVTVFGHDDVASVPVVRGGETLALVHGISYPEPHVSENLARRFRRDPAMRCYQVGLLHANVDGRGGHENYAPASLADLRGAELDYWALGHVHTREVLLESGPTVVYPGNLQARHALEQGPRGFYLVEVADGAASLEFVEVGRVRFEQVTIDIAGLPDLDAVYASLTAAAEADRGTATNSVLRARIRGAGPSHAALRSSQPEEHLKYLRDLAPAGVWWDDLQLDTRPPLDRSARLEAGDFVADLLRRSDAGRSNAALSIAALVAELEAHPHLRPAARHLDLRAFVADATALWDEAETTAYDLIEAGMVGSGMLDG